MATPTVVSYVAKRPLKVGNSVRQPGEAVPEAASWPNVRAYVRGGSLAVVAPKIEGEKVAMAPVPALAHPAPSPAPRPIGKLKR